MFGIQHKVEGRFIPFGSCTIVGTNRPKGETRLDSVEQTMMTPLTKLLDMEASFLF